MTVLGLCSGWFLWNFRLLGWWSWRQPSTPSFVKSQFLPLWWKPTTVECLKWLLSHLCGISVFHCFIQPRCWEMTERSWSSSTNCYCPGNEDFVTSASGEVGWNGGVDERLDVPRGTSNPPVGSWVGPQMLWESPLLFIPVVVLPPCGVRVN